MDFETLALASYTKYVFHNPRNGRKRQQQQSQPMMLSPSVAGGVSVIWVCLRSYLKAQINLLLQISKQVLSPPPIGQKKYAILIFELFDLWVS